MTTQATTQAAAAGATTTQESVLDQLVAATGASTEQRSEVERDLKNTFQAIEKWFLPAEGQIDKKTMQLLDAAIAKIDGMVSDQLNHIMHHPKFQKLESTWQGLRYLTQNTDTSDQLLIRVFNVTKDELRTDLMEATKYDQSALFHKIYTHEYDMPGGKPYGILIGDYEFTAGSGDVALLRKISEVAAAAHAPFIAAASPKMFREDLTSYEKFDVTVGWSEVMAGKSHAAWNSFRRESEDSRYVGLTMPRVLARLPYGKESPVKEFNYDEGVDGRDHSKYLWMNAAWAFGARVTNAFAKDGWLARIRGLRGGGKVENLPVHVFTTDNGMKAIKCPTEVSIPDRCENELSSLGFLPLQHWKDTDYAAFVGAQSCQRPKEYVGAEGDFATANAALSAKINYILCVSRFSHCLQVMVRTWVGDRYSREKLQDKLNDWIKSYVVDNPDNLPEEERGKYPLKEARIDVQEIPRRPGWYRAQAFLKPHLHLEGLSTAMSLVAQIPAPKGK